MNSNPLTPTAKPLMSVRRLRVRLRQRGLLPKPARGDIKAVENLDLDLKPGEALGVIGEAGCGKTVLARTLAGLQQPTSGSIRFADEELAGADESVWSAQRRHIQLVDAESLQDLKPKTTLGRVLGGALKTQCPELTTAARNERIEATLLRVGLQAADEKRTLKSLSPLELRLFAIARAMASDPQILICDEPAAGLDEDGQSQIATLLARLHRMQDLAIVYMAQQPALAQAFCERVLVLYLGRVMEQGECEAVFASPAHPYTRALLAATPTVEVSKRGERRVRMLLDGERPHPAQPPIGCVYHTRCPMAEAACVREAPHPHRTGTTPRHYAACLFAPQPRG